MNNKKKLTIVIVLLVVVIVILGVIGFNHKAKAPEVQNGGGSTSTATATSTVTTSTVSIVSSTTKNYTGSSFSFTYPSSWSIFSALPLFMTNFNGQYGPHNVIPAGGVQLSIVTTTISGNTDAIMAVELQSATHLTTTATTVNGVACTKAVYQVNYAPGATAQNISIYCPQGTELWKIYLSYPAGDRAESADLSDFNDILDSMRLSG